MNIALVGDSHQEIRGLVEKAGFAVVEGKPEFVFSYGGDGTLMRAEHLYPGVPKLVLRNSVICKKCSPLPNETALTLFASGEFETEEIAKLEASAKGRTISALNDVVVRNSNSRHAMRCKLSVNGRDIGKTIIGDGAVIATPFGSTAYYRSITKSFFEVGIGIAFNNSTEPFDHMVVDERSTVKILIERGPAIVYADNQREHIELEAGDEVVVRKSPQGAKIIRLSPRA